MNAAVTLAPPTESVTHNDSGQVAPTVTHNACLPATPRCAYKRESARATPGDSWWPAWLTTCWLEMEFAVTTETAT